MAEHTPNQMQSEARIDPVARQGMRRFLASIDAEGLTTFIRDCLRAVDRKVAVSIFNDDVNGMPMPASSDRGRIASVLRGLLRAGRPDGFECLQNLTSHHLERSLDDEQYEAYSEAVDALNEAAEAEDAAKIRSAAAGVVKAMRAGMDDAAVMRYVQVHALPETVDALLAAAGGTAAEEPEAATPAKKKTAAKKTAAKKTTTKKTAAKKSGAKKAGAGKSGAKKTSAPKPTATKAPAKKTGTRKTTAK
jgi:hypothetical protein